MARYFGEVQGNRGAAHRLGSANSGITSRTQGWNSGVEVHGRVAQDGDNDHFDIYVNGGSTGWGDRTKIGSVIRGEFVPEKS
jgi:hypothetical protein